MNSLNDFWHFRDNLIRPLYCCILIVLVMIRRNRWIHQRFTMPTETGTSAPKLSPAEAVKEQSRQLRGSIALELVEAADHFNEANKNLLKFHGTYQQEDRDARKNRSKDGVGKHYMFMVRCKIPGGRVTAAQYLALDDLAGHYANGTLRFTTRQGIQFHGVLKSEPEGDHRRHQRRAC